MIVAKAVGGVEEEQPVERPEASNEEGRRCRLA